MRIKSITLKGFRNLKNTELSFDSGINNFAFVGQNGHGKTNLLEAIFVNAISKSFRANKAEQMISFDQNFCSTKVHLKKSEDSKELEFIQMQSPVKKGLKLNGVQKKAIDYIGHLNVVFFSPDDMNMIHAAPTSRRRYIDLLLSQFDRDYLNISLKYQQILKQRNALLKRIGEGNANHSELNYWDQQLADLGVQIIKKRESLIMDLSHRAASFYHQVSSEQDKLKIIYRPSVKASNTEEYFSQLSAEHKRDVISGYTNLGPHRDDLLFLCNGKNMASYASRGEWRSLILTLKFAEIHLLKEKTEEWPILLLDDVFSELDDYRQKYLFNELKEVQTFITTTHEEFLEVIDDEVEIYKVDNGQFEKV